MKALICLILIATFVVSCSNKPQKSNVKLSLGRIVGSGTYFYGGVLIMGHTLDDKEGFTTFVQDMNSDFQLDLKKGRWEFLAIGWQGLTNVNLLDNYLTGNHQCGYFGPIDLINDQTNIAFDLRYDNCPNVPNHGAILAGSNFLESYNGSLDQFLKIKILSCKYVDVATKTCLDENGGADFTNYGLTRSVRLEIEGDMKSQAGNHPLPGFMTKCFPTNGTSSGDTGVLDVRFPAGNPGLIDKIVGSKIHLFTTSDCSGSPIIYSFKDSAFSQGINLANQKAIADRHYSGGSYVTRLLVEHNSNTVSAMNGFSPFGFGADGDLNLGVGGSLTRVVADYGRVIGFSETIDQSATVLELPTGAATNIKKFDEIVMYVNDNNNSGCGSLSTGLILNFRVQDKLVQQTGPYSVMLTLDKKLSNIFGPYPLHAKLIQSLGAVGSCSIQVAKVYHYRNLIMDQSAVLNALNFDSSAHVGGILSFKVSDTFAVQATSASPAILDASAMGFVNFSPTAGNCGGLIPCMRMGSSTNAAVRGGGIIIAEIANLKMSGDGSTSKLIVKNEGEHYGSISGSINANGGHSKIYVGNIDVVTGVVPTVVSTTNASFNGTALYYGNAGPNYVEICQVPPAFTVPSFVTGTANENAGDNTNLKFFQQRCNQ